MSSTSTLSAASADLAGSVTSARPADSTSADPRPSGELPTVIFVHGLRTSGALWDEQIRALTAAGFPTMAVDLPAHGVRRGERFTMAAAVEALDAAIAKLSTTQYVLVGLSLGGYTVLHYSARVEERANASRPSGSSGSSGSLVSQVSSDSQDPQGSSGVPQLIGVLAAACSSDPSTKPIRAYRNVAARVVAMNSRSRELLGHVRWPWARPRSTPSAQAGGQVAAQLSGGSSRSEDRPPEERLPWAVVTDALTALHTVSSIKDLMRITVPVLLVNGRWDHLRLEERAYAAAAPNTKLVVIPGAKHDVSLEAPVAFNRTLLKFLTSLPRSASAQRA